MAAQPLRDVGVDLGHRLPDMPLLANIPRSGLAEIAIPESPGAPEPESGPFLAGENGRWARMIPARAPAALARALYIDRSPLMSP